MKRTQNTLRQIVRNLREAERMFSEGQLMVEECKRLEITEQTYYQWLNQHDGMKAEDAKRLKEFG